MTLAQIIDLFRIEALDSAVPYFFSDTEAAIWATEAQEEAAIRAKLIRETSSTHLTRFDIRKGVMTYPLDPRMFEIDYASMTFKGSNGMLPYVLSITTPGELDGMRPFWRTLPYRPTGIIQYDTTLGVDCLPDTAYDVKVEGYRLPMAPLALTGVSEILAHGTLTLDSGTSGQVSEVLVNGIDILGSAVAFDTSLTQTATNVAAQCTANSVRYTVTAVGTTLTITDIAGTGSMHNGYSVGATTTGIATTGTALSGGVDAVATSPEISAIHHRWLVKWMLYRARLKEDAETHDPKKAAAALAEFESIFGKRPDASYRKRQNASTPHRVTAYP